MITKSASRREGIKLFVSLGLLGGLSGCGVVARAIREGTTGMASPGPTNQTRAKVAWQYFRTQRNPATGLAEATAGSGFATSATLGDQLAAAICAYRLGAIDRREFDGQVSQLLVFLNGMPLSGGLLPGRFYSTASGQLMDPPNQGIDPGWSGVQIARLLVWLHALAADFPQYTYPIAGIVDRWQLCRVLDADGKVLVSLPGLAPRPDVGSGYEAYAAQGYRAWGLPAVAPRYSPDYAVSVEGLDFPIGGPGQPASPQMIAPYALLGLELGWQGFGGTRLDEERDLLGRLLEAQERRRKRTGVITARSDFRLNAAPYQVDSAVVAGGTPWGTTGAEGDAYPQLGLVSTKAAFAMWALDAPSAGAALGQVDTLRDESLGWLEGRYETTGGYEWARSASTNAIVLEALLHKEVGRIVPARHSTPLTPGGAIGVTCSASG